MDLRKFGQKIINGLVGEDQPDCVLADMAESGLDYTINELECIPKGVTPGTELSSYMCKPTTNTDTSAETKGSIS